MVGHEHRINSLNDNVGNIVLCFDTCEIFNEFFIILKQTQITFILCDINK